MINYYQILEVSPRSDQKTIKAAYRTLMFKYKCHPDLGGSEKLARQINEAYEVLGDPNKRQKYNGTLGPENFESKRDGLNDLERRRVPRVSVDFKVKYKAGSADFAPARILDLSYLGCRLQTKDLLEDGTRVTVDIDGKKIDGVVRWKRMFHPSIFQRIHEAGIQFVREFEEIDQVSL
ncbi:J domain-containing protein, partial [bacterium]|nr:J domain-containing protein [bacterium]